ncbi:hypothetical protein GCK72_011379 [Caenorhabditis remanei]|uniref:F-box domain-containing protein n=1 Tax=Caenorhabditis remanei TaxID=31234 RepID=A0A6A5H9K9_CAERE|nr:hypothetical protein GCK72_011379 [Caenorhabditis remanei]KAF1763113.1 hypothetical protein GCK72_011379 [Caenorhabditis remanei]
MTPQPFKLLHLPIVALRNVLKLLNPIELFELSQCSRRALSIIPLSGSKHFKLHMNQFSSSIHVNDYAFRMYNNDVQSAYILHGNRTFMESTVKIRHHSEREIISFWEDRHVRLKTVFFHLSNVFKCPIECARFLNTIPAVVYMSIIDFISSRQSEINELNVGGENLSDEHVIEIFDKLRVADHLEMSHQFSITPSIPFSSKSISIWNSAWITTEHLNLMKHCIVIELHRSTLTDHDMTLFLNDWKSGQFPNLQYSSIKSSFLSKNFTPFGLPSLQNTVNPQYYARIIFGSPRVIFGAIDFQRNDGVVAKVRFDDQDGDLQILLF